MNKDMLHLVATHIHEREVATQEGRVVYVIARDGTDRRAGEIYIKPIVYDHVLQLAREKRDENVSFAIHWLDQSPAEHVSTSPSIALRDILLHSTDITLIALFAGHSKERLK